VTTLHLPSDLLDAMTRHAEIDWPIEACGVLVGRDGRAERHVPMRNVAETERSYSVDPRDQLELEAELAETGEAITVVYHSHTRSGPQASGVDMAYARQAGAHYLILAVGPDPDQGGPPIFRELAAYICDGSGLQEVDVSLGVPGGA
jgi:proteasome lid subunit RPN8/RPN11